MIQYIQFKNYSSYVDVFTFISNIKSTIKCLKKNLYKIKFIIHIRKPIIFPEIHVISGNTREFLREIQKLDDICRYSPSYDKLILWVYLVNIEF